MSIRTPRGQRGITLIEIILVCAIMAAATVAIFAFSKKASVAAAVETEQRQVENIVKTVDGLFATQPNFAALGTNGAVYLKERAARTGLKFGTNPGGEPAMVTGLGGGSGTLTLSSQSVALGISPALPNNAYRLAYSGMTTAQCTSVVMATYPVATIVSISQEATDVSGTRIAERGQLKVSPDRIAASCSEGETPSVFLYFVPSRAIAASTPRTPPPSARCNPIHERQQIACPVGQIGSITQERDGTCTGAGNTMAYTAWTSIINTCAVAPVAPTTVTPPTAPDMCTMTTFTNVVACPSGQLGQIIQTRDLDSCAGTYTPWTTLSTVCQSAGGPATCMPSTQDQILACSAGMSGEIRQSRSSDCSTPNSAPSWLAWQTYSNTCRGTATCEPQRETGPAPCSAGQYGAWSGERERFRTCVNATTQGAWSAWNVLSPNNGCASCPADLTESTMQWVSQSTPCPVGQVGTNAWEAEQVSTRTVSYNCPAGTTNLPPPSTTGWSGWASTGATRNVVNTCVPATCPGSSNEFQWLGTSGACPVGQTGTYTWEYEQARSRTCNAGTWTSWGGWASTGATRNVVNTCVPATCSGSSTQTQWLGNSATCPAGQSGTNAWEYEQVQSRICTAGTWGSWGAWGNTGATRNPVYTCAPNCVPPAPETESQWVGTSAACPAGQSGTHTWEYAQTRTRTAYCPAATGPFSWNAWGAWANTGATRNVVNTCAAAEISSCGCAGNLLYMSSYYASRYGVSFTTAAACAAAKASSPWPATSQCVVESTGTPGVSLGCYHLMQNNWISSVPPEMFCIASPDLCPTGTVPAGPIGVCKLP